MGDFGHDRQKKFNNKSNKGNYGKSNKGFRNGEDIRPLENYFKSNILKISSLNEGYDQFILNAKKYAEFLKDNKMSTSQIRKIYSEIMSADTVMELKRLRPKLAYVHGKNIKNIAITSLLAIIDEGLEKLSLENKDMEKESIKEFMETIVAYRKYYGDNN
ncbi:type III-A CRISPR-associated protein Csm2 [Clostridium sp. Marseille-QA1073]